MKTKILYAFSIMAVLLLLNGCEKAAKGDQGQAGTNGTNGTDGTNGTNGTNGNANVQNFDITVSSYQWTYDNLYERWYYRYSSSANSNSLVYGYVMSGSGKQSIPYYSCISSNAWCYQYDLATYLFGSPSYIEFQYTNYVSKTTRPSYDEYFYFIIVPPAQRNVHPNLDWSNYDAVKKALNLGEPIKIKN